MRAQPRVTRDGAELRHVGAVGVWCLRSRPGRNCSEQFPALAALAAALAGRDALLDGERVCLDVDGRPDFHRLRHRLPAADAGVAAHLAAEHPATLAGDRGVDERQQPAHAVAWSHPSRIERRDALDQPLGWREFLQRP